MLADKLQVFNNIQHSLLSGPRRYEKASEALNKGKQVMFQTSERLLKRKHSHFVPNERSLFKRYGCGRPDLKKYRCPNYNTNSSQRNDTATNHANTYTIAIRSPRLILIDIPNLEGGRTCMCRYRIFTFNCWGKDVRGIQG
ncbi:hypothetical protein NPIL_537251 [Nephila pilipes]|uniref:Uncharacterized protein n=1 Tax=Nephila pilipes TaxID=299642 RepID=A0A8X6U3Q2_NEPPI|nr:hypothetical protein NPIL_537251 [Nephila pilipes]